MTWGRSHWGASHYGSDVETYSAFTADSIIGAIGTSTFTLDSRLATPGTSTFTLDSLVTECFTLDSILGAVGTSTFNVDSHIGEDGTTSFTADSRVGGVDTSTFTLDSILSEGAGAYFTVDSVIFASPYYALGSVDISDYVTNISTKGLGKSLSTHALPGRADAYLAETGTQPLEYTLQLRYQDIDALDDLKSAINSMAEGILWYPGRSDWYHNVAYVEVRPVEHRFQYSKYVTEVVLKLEDPYLYHTFFGTQSTSGQSLPWTSQEFLSEGSTDGIFTSIKVTGKYSGGHAEDLTLSVMDGATAESTLTLSDELLSDEEIELQNGELLVCTYTDAFPNDVRFNRDVYASSGATISAGQLDIASGGYATYKLSGPHATVENVLLEATLTYTGSPKIRVSTDGATWADSISASEITSGAVNSLYLTGTEKRGTVYIQFYCPVGSTFSLIDDMTFVATRAIASDDALLVAPGEDRAIKINGTGSATADIEIAFRNRRWP